MQTEAQQVTQKIRPSDARGRLLLTQEQLAHLAGVTAKVVSNAENGIAIRRLSAFAILNAINRKRTEQNLPTLEIDDLDWKIQGK